jgi:hypothetical protein
MYVKCFMTLFQNIVRMISEISKTGFFLEHRYECALNELGLISLFGRKDHDLLLFEEKKSGYTLPLTMYYVIEI